MVIKIALKNVRDVACCASLVCVVVTGAGYPSVVVLYMDPALRVLETKEPPWKRWHEILSALR